MEISIFHTINQTSSDIGKFSLLITPMQRVLIKNLNRSDVEPVRAGYCSTFWLRLKGLMFHPPLPYDEGLLLVYPRDNRMDTSIHMLGVSTDLAVVWINQEHQVVDVRLAKKGLLAYLPQDPARFVLEMSPARIDDFSVGDKVEIVFE